MARQKGRASPRWASSRPVTAITGMRLRVARAGLIDHPEEAFASHGGEESRALPAGMVYYQQQRALAPRL